MANATTEIYIKAAGGSDRFMVAVSILVGVAVGDVVVCALVSCDTALSAASVGVHAPQLKTPQLHNSSHHRHHHQINGELKYQAYEQDGLSV